MTRIAAQSRRVRVSDRSGLAAAVALLMTALLLALSPSAAAHSPGAELLYQGDPVERRSLMIQSSP